MTLFQRNETQGYQHILCESSEEYRPLYYTWDDYDYYNYCRAGLWIEHLRILKEMNQ